MSAARPAADAAELLSHLAWVQRLAAALLRDAAAAEDLAQETLRVTLEQPRGRVGSGATMKSWLGSVARRLAVDRFRADRSRAARERQFAPREPTGDTFEPCEIVERSARQQRVARAVHELAEPYRSTVLYRYLDELSTRDVAARMAVTEELVRKRLERGLEQLRERLDREFGTNTKGWAIALVSWPGVAAVTVKTKLVVSAAALLVGVALTWKAIEPARQTAPPTFAAQTPVEAARTDASDGAGSKGLPASPSREEADRTASAAGAASASAARASVMHVHVVDPDGRPCTEGRIFGFYGQGGTDPSVPLRSFDRAITGDVTTIEFPRATGCLLIAAAVSGLVPGNRQGASWPEELWESPAERIERDLTIVVGQPLQGPRLQGNIVVDGKPRVPKGLAIDLRECADPWNEGDWYVRIHALDANYEIAPRPAGAFKLWVTSDETEPRMFKVAADDAAVDLELASARTLLLTVLDRATGQPLPGLELHLRSNVVIEKTSFFRELWSDHSHFFVTGADGVARLTGIPQDGSIEVRRDASAIPAEMKVGAETFTIQRMREPLLELRLTRKLPAVIEKTIRIDREDRRATLRGRLAEALRANDGSLEVPLEVHWALVGEDGRALAYDDAVKLDAGGGFAFDVDRHHDYRIWAEREAIRFSEIVALRVDDDEIAPLELVPRRGGEILLRFVRCPAEGFIDLFVPDGSDIAPRGSVFASTGGTIERRIPVDGPTTIDVGWVKERGSKSGKRRALAVDPATTPVVEVDLQGDLGRAVALDLGEFELPVQSQLWLLPLGPGDRVELDPAKASRVSVQFRGRESAGPVVIDPGRYLAFLNGAPGIVGGIVEVAAGSRNAPITIHLEVEEHARATLGAGIQLVKIGGIELPEPLQKAFTIRFASHPEFATADPFLLPADAEFTLLAE